MTIDQLGVCTILSRDDIKKLNIKMDKLERICNLLTPGANGITAEGIRKNIMEYIYKEAEKRDADVAVINGYCDSYGTIFFSRSCDYTLYKYKTNKKNKKR